MESLTGKIAEKLHLSTPAVSLPSEFEKNSVTHVATNNATWKESLAGTAAPEAYTLTKTLVFKPKVAKSVTPTLIVVVALESTGTGGVQVAKAASEKEARLAAADVVKEALNVTVDQGMDDPLAWSLVLGCWAGVDGSVSAFDFEGECVEGTGVT